MKFLRKFRTIKTVIVLVGLCCLMLAFNGCIIDDLREKMDAYDGHWVKDKDGNRIGCMFGGTECAVFGAKESPR